MRTKNCPSAPKCKNIFRGRRFSLDFSECVGIVWSEVIDMKKTTQKLTTALLLMTLMAGCAAPVTEQPRETILSYMTETRSTEEKPPKQESTKSIPVPEQTLPTMAVTPGSSTEETTNPVTEGAEAEIFDNRQEDNTVTTEPELTEPVESLPAATEPKAAEPMPVEQTEPLGQTEPTQPPAETKPAETQPPAPKPTETPKVTDPTPTTPTPTQPKPTEPKPTEPEPESKPGETATIPTEPPTEPTITVESTETPPAPTEQTTEPPTVPTAQIPEPTELPTTSTEPTDPEPEPLTAQMLRELEQAGLQYAVSRYGYEVDYSLGFGAVCGYYPGMSGYFNADGYDNLLSLVKTNVDVTTDYLMGQSGPIWGYREDNGQVWRTLINIAIVDDGGGSYTVWVFYG